jgi:hypothetical protein
MGLDEEVCRERVIKKVATDPEFCVLASNNRL